MISPQSSSYESQVLESMTFSALFEEQVKRTPDRVAIVFEGRNTTYRELNQQANRIACYIRERGFAKEDRIGLCLDRSTDAVACMLGILKSGCAFVPLDPEFPVDRLRYIVDHSQIQLIVCEDAYRSLYSSDVNCSIIPPQEIGSCELSQEDIVIDIQDEDLAYVMYTSGSTGKPKGVQIEHGSLLTYCLADKEIYQLEAADRTLQFSTLNFDVAIEEIFPPLLVGSCVVIRPRQRADASIELSHLVECHSVTALHIATAYWNEWVDLMVASQKSVPSSLRLVVVTGEKISVEHYKRWLSLCHHDLLWCNAYGPTETTVTCTAFIPESGWSGQQMPIGKPLPGYEAHILDESMQPVSTGATGHLYIGGRGLARGYLGRPDLTEKAFVTVELAEKGPTRLYRTGDLARWLDSGDIEFSGRVDHQLKIGSYRIEPGEIESIVNSHSAVRESLIIGHEENGQKQLVAYVVPNDRSLTVEQIDGYSRERLPVYMCPSKWLLLEAMPKTINGKIDRFALPSPNLAVVARHQERTAPRNERERELCKIWSGVLKIDDIGIHDDFFLLGGSSLLVTRVIAQMTSQLKATIPVRDFFAHPTIASIASHLSHLQNDADCDQPQTEDSSATIRSALPEIQPFPVENQGCSLFAIHYPPVIKRIRSRKHLVVIVPSYGHEYARGYRNLQQLAVLLAQNGFDVVRFDLSGTGNSLGDETRLSWSVWQSDIRQVVTEARKKLEPNSVSTIGLRLGGNLVASLGNLPMNQVVAWDPVLDMNAYMKKLEDWHRYMLGSLTTFLAQRKSDKSECMGYPWPIVLRRELKELGSLDSQTKNSTSEYHQVLSKGLPNANDSLDSGIPTWKLTHVEDAIAWDDRASMNKAFSSVESYQAILRILKGEI